MFHFRGKCDFSNHGRWLAVDAAIRYKTIRVKKDAVYCAPTRPTILLRSVDVKHVIAFLLNLFKSEIFQASEVFKEDL
jgi:hypothetical protein